LTFNLRQIVKNFKYEKATFETKDATYSPAYWNEREGSRPDPDMRLIRYGARQFDRAYYNIPLSFRKLMDIKRIITTVKNMTNNETIPEPQEPIVKNEDGLLDVSGCNLKTWIISEKDTIEHKTEVWDGGCLLTTRAAEKLGVGVGSKIVSRSGLKMIVSQIYEKLPHKAELIIGRTKIYTREAVIEELRLSKGYVFIFKIDFGVITPSDFSTYPLSRNWMEVMASNKEINDASQWKKDWNYINQIFATVYMNFGKEATFVNGEGPKLIKGIYPSWISQPDLNYALPPELYYYRKIKSGKRKGETIRSKQIEDADPMREPGEEYNQYILDRFVNNEVAYIDWLLKPITEQFRPILVPRYCELNEIQLSDKYKDHYVNNEVVMVARDPIISSGSIKFFKVRLVDNLLQPYGTIGMRPENFKSYSADADGDTLLIVKPSYSVPIKLTEHDVPKIDMLEGGFELSKFSESTKAYSHKQGEWSVEDFKIAREKDRVLADKSIAGVGGLRKRVIAAIQNMEDKNTIDIIIRLFDVEGGMSKVGKKQFISPRVHYYVCATIWALISGKDKISFSKLNAAEIIELSKFVKIEGSNILVDYPENITSKDMKLKNHKPSPVGNFLLTHVFPADGKPLENLIEMYNMKDESVYGRVLKQS